MTAQTSRRLFKLWELNVGWASSQEAEAFERSPTVIALTQTRGGHRDLLNPATAFMVSRELAALVADGSRSPLTGPPLEPAPETADEVATLRDGLAEQRRRAKAARDEVRVLRKAVAAVGQWQEELGETVRESGDAEAISQQVMRLVAKLDRAHEISECTTPERVPAVAWLRALKSGPPPSRPADDQASAVEQLVAAAECAGAPIERIAVALGISTIRLQRLRRTTPIGKAELQTILQQRLSDLLRGQILYGHLEGTAFDPPPKPTPNFITASGPNVGTPHYRPSHLKRNR